MSMNKWDLQKTDRKKFGLGAPPPFQPPRRSDRAGRFVNYSASGSGLRKEQFQSKWSGESAFEDGIKSLAQRPWLGRANATKVAFARFASGCWARSFERVDHLILLPFDLQLGLLLSLWIFNIYVSIVNCKLYPLKSKLNRLFELISSPSPLIKIAHH